MSIAAGNSNFTKLFDSNLDAKVFEALVSAGVLPQGFRVIVGTVDLEGVAAADERPILGSDGNQIVLSAGQQVVLTSWINTGAAFTATSEVAIGLAAASGNNQALASVLVAAADAEVGQSSAPALVGSTNIYLAAGVTVATNSAASTVQVVLVVV